MRINLYRTIPIWISKKACHIAKVHYYKMCFPFFFTNSGTSSYRSA